MLIEETPSVGLLIQSKALSSIDSKGQLGRAGARVVAAELQLRNVTVRNAALRPVTAGGRLESPVILSTDSVHNWTTGNISIVSRAPSTRETFSRHRVTS